jgi:Protein of unknown function with PCYCGC motif
MRHKRRWLIGAALAAFCVSGYAAFVLRTSSGRLAENGFICHSGRCCKVCPTGASAADQKAVAGSAGVLNPLMFIGQAREAYIVARQNPGLLAQLWCYCGCDRTSGHRSLLDCYRDYHGANCAICTGEALEANQLFNQGSPVEQIRDALRVRFGRRS